MFCAPVVACEISDPPTTPRGTSRSAPGLTTFIGRGETRRPTWPASLPTLAIAAGLRRHLDLERPRLVVDLERRVVDMETLVQQVVEAAAQLVAVVAGADDDVGRQRGEARCDLPHVEVVNLDDSRLGGERPADLVGIEPRRRGLHEYPP